MTGFMRPEMTYKNLPRTFIPRYLHFKKSKMAGFMRPEMTYKNLPRTFIPKYMTFPILYLSDFSCTEIVDTIMESVSVYTDRLKSNNRHISYSKITLNYA